MYHTITFDTDLQVDLEVSPRQPLERMLLRKGTRARVQLRPYVIDTVDGPSEVADLFFEDGSATRAVSFGSFSFAEE